jgi:hypothetical protein
LFVFFNLLYAHLVVLALPSILLPLTFMYVTLWV